MYKTKHAYKMHALRMILVVTVIGLLLEAEKLVSFVYERKEKKNIYQK